MEEGVYLLKLELNRVRCFGDKAILRLNNNKTGWERWTIILGNNGTGKTSLLQFLANFRTYLDYIHFEDENGKESLIPAYNSEFIRFRKKFKIAPINSSSTDERLSGQETSLGLRTTLAIADFEEPDMTYMRTGTNSYRHTVNTKQEYEFLKIYGYGANRFMSRNSLSESKSVDSATLFDEDAKLINAEEWLLQLDYSASKSSQIQEFATKRRDQVKEILLEVLPDIEDIRFTEPTKENLKTTVEFKTPYGWVTIHQLSLGYKTMVAWMVDLAARMFERYPNDDKPLEQPAIVLVDEIDLHMHPKWQRKIFDYLSEKFPKTQFIVTAHSPLIVQSAPKDANIVLLRREGDHVVIDNDIQSVHNWRIDQILNSDLFGNISERSSETEAWMEERVQLIQKSNLNEAEQQRLDELNKKAHELPTADNQRDIEAMQIIREAADYLTSKKSSTPA